MTGNPLDRHAIQDLVTAHPEVEFALVLTRTIDSVRADPEQLRGAIYELARQKLREQFTSENASEIPRLTAALEVAIQGVEAHCRKDRERQRPISGPDFRSPPPPTGIADQHPATIQVLEAPLVSVFVENDDSVRNIPPSPRRSRSRETASAWGGRFAASWRFILVVGVLLLAIVGTLRSGQFSARDKGNVPAVASREIPGKNQSPVQAAPTELEPPKAVPLVPTTFGIYAVAAGRLFELEPLQIRAPDIRVAVSAAIITPSRTLLPDGNIKFIVFRRESAGTAPDQVDVRVVAGIEQAMTFDSSGKPVVSKTEETWVIRNISIPYRTAPVKDNLEMYEVQSRDANAELVPGRYALVIKGQAFDFTIAGDVTDTRQCLERVTAANGTFYSPCQKPQ
jgi:hypothetical protein